MTSRVLLLMAVAASTWPAWSQTLPGQVWFELPAEECHAGQPFIVGVHLDVGPTEPNLIDFFIEFDNALLDLAFSGEPPDFPNPDLAYGETLIGAGISDLLAYHSEGEPGLVRVMRVGGKGPAWPLTGDIELLQITFHPVEESTDVPLEGSIVDLKDADLMDIGTPEVLPATFDVLPVVHVPAADAAGLVVLGCACTFWGIAALRRSLRRAR